MQRRVRLSMLKSVGLGALVVGLLALVAVATFRETASRKEEQVVPNAAFLHAERPAMTAAEEKYSHALWPIHAQVKQGAVKMTFAGLAYKIGDIRRAEVRERVAPLIVQFDRALSEADKLQPPASMRQLHQDYVEATRLYRDAATTMVKVVADGRDQHLIEAQAMSSRAADLSLKVGDALWPGEFKPN